jgi:1-acyl-sn-glycerol-3-phosphate acyltransferase
MRKWIAELILFRLWGWRLEKTYPANVPQSIVATFFHTSNWDFPIGILLRPIMHCNIRFAGKDSLFRFPLGVLMRSLGGYPVVRSKNTNFVDNVADIFKKEADFKLCVTPEGKREKPDKLKTGFYYIALKAGVPIVVCKFDWGKKVIGFSDPFMPTGNYEADLSQMLRYLEGAKGRIPANDYDITQHFTPQP